MVKSFSVISGLALAVLAQGAYVPEAKYEPVYEAATTPCTESTTAYPVPTGYEHTTAPTYEEPSTSVEYGYPVTSSSVEYDSPVSSTTAVYDSPVSSSTGMYDIPVSSSAGVYDSPESSSTTCETPAAVTPYTTYTAVYTSCESYPTVYTSAGELCTTDYSTTHYMTTTLCETTPIETPSPTTITKSYETTISSCVTYPTTCETSGTSYATETSSTEYSTSTVCTTEVYTPVPSSYYTEVPVASYPYTPSMGTAYPQPTYPANHTSYSPAPQYPVSTGGAASLAPGIAAFAAVFGGIVAALL